MNGQNRPLIKPKRRLVSETAACSMSTPFVSSARGMQNVRRPFNAADRPQIINRTETTTPPPPPLSRFYFPRTFFRRVPPAARGPRAPIARRRRRRCGGGTTTASLSATRADSTTSCTTYVVCMRGNINSSAGRASLGDGKGASLLTQSASSQTARSYYYNDIHFGMTAPPRNT